jgi:beta-phosphoglucomutase family hydrolase
LVKTGIAQGTGGVNSAERVIICHMTHHNGTHGTYRAAIFDMDGTLVDNMAYHQQTWTQMLAEMGHAISAEEFMRRTAGWTNREILRELVNPDISDEDIGAFAHRKENAYRELYRPHLAALAGALPFLDALRARGVKLAVATSAPTDNIDFTLDGAGLREKFDAVVGAADISRGKPDPEIFLKAADRLGVPPEACLVFEDATAGIEAARRAGMRVVVITTTLDADSVRDDPNVIATAPDFTALDAVTLGL